MSESDTTDTRENEYGQYFTGDETVFVLQFNAEQIQDLMNELSEMENPAHSIHQYNYHTGKDAFAFFSVASRTADLVENGDVEIYTTDDTGGSTIITPENVISFLFDHTVESSPPIIETVRQTVQNQVVSEEQFQIRTPPQSIVMKTMQEQFESGFIEEWIRFFTVAEGYDDTVDDGVVLSLLAGASNEELLYDIGKWAESIGLTSQATLSRYKNKLEQAGLVSTVKVPRDIGRPRQRLRLTETANNMETKEILDVIIEEL